MWAQRDRGDRDGDKEVGLGAIGTQSGGDGVVGTEGQRKGMGTRRWDWGGWGWGW